MALVLKGQHGSGHGDSSGGCPKQERGKVHPELATKLDWGTAPRIIGL